MGKWAVIPSLLRDKTWRRRVETKWARRFEPRRKLNVIIVGAGIGGLTSRFSAARGTCRIYDGAPQMLPLGVSINIRPHASGRSPGNRRSAACVDPDAEAVLSFGQLIYREPLGRYAGRSIHSSRFIAASCNSAARCVVERLGADAVVTEDASASRSKRIARHHRTIS
jgi:hypothetical protein